MDFVIIANGETNAITGSNAGFFGTARPDQKSTAEQLTISGFSVIAATNSAQLANTWSFYLRNSPQISGVTTVLFGQAHIEYVGDPTLVQ